MFGEFLQCLVLNKETAFLMLWKYSGRLMPQFHYYEVRHMSEYLCLSVAPLGDYLPFQFRFRMDSVKEKVLRSLGYLTDPEISGVMNALQELGVETSSDLSYVNEVDMVRVLRPIQVRKLLESSRLEGKLLFYFPKFLFQVYGAKCQQMFILNSP